MSLNMWTSNWHFNLFAFFFLLGDLWEFLPEDGVFEHKIFCSPHLWWVHAKCRWVSNIGNLNNDNFYTIFFESTSVCEPFSFFVSEHCQCPKPIVDSRTEDWLLMSSPLPQTIIIIAYIYFVTSLGPKIMENRKAFDLKGVLVVYNFGVVALSLYMIYEVCWFLFCFGFCQSASEFEMLKLVVEFKSSDDRL